MMKANGGNRIIITSILLAGIFLGYVFFRINSQKNAQPTNLSKIQVVTSFYPLANFAQNVGGNLVQVSNITPPGAEPHDYEPTPQDLVKAYSSKLFIINGNGVDAWGEKITSDLESKRVVVLKMSDHLQSLKNSSADENLNYDPHFWLSPVNAQKEVDVITEALISIDPGHKTEYNQNRNIYKTKLIGLDQSYRNGLASCQQHLIVTSHNAFNYLAQQYNFNTLYILGLSPDGEPSPKTIANVVDAVKKDNIKYIFFESLVSPKLAQTIAQEAGVQTLELNPIEGLSTEDIATGKDYISLMQYNLTNLRTALSCQ